MGFDNLWFSVLILVLHGFLDPTKAQMPANSKDSLDWKTIGDSTKNEADRLPKKMRHIPGYYFLPRRSMLANIAIYGSCIVGGIGAGMLTEIWINKKIQEDGNGVLWEFNK